MSKGAVEQDFFAASEAAVADLQLRRKLENATGRHLDHVAAKTSERFEPDPARHERYAYRQVQFEAAYAALLPISEALA